MLVLFGQRQAVDTKKELAFIGSPAQFSYFLTGLEKPGKSEKSHMNIKIVIALNKDLGQAL